MNANDNFPFKPMTIYKIVSELIDGVDREFVMIDREEYNNYILYLAFKNKKLVDTEYLKKKQEQDQKQEETELKRINEIEERERHEKEKEEQRKEAIEKEIKINKFHNDKIKKQKEELRDEYKEVFNNDKEAKILKCDFCNDLRVFPIHFKDENNNTYKREYTKEKQKLKSICCMDCFQSHEQYKEDYKLKKTEHCLICNSHYIALNETAIIKHINSIKHKKNKEIYESNLIRNKEELPKKNLALLTVKELNKICSKTIKEDGTYYINNYSKIKKDELIKQMDVIYDLLVF
jgi:hypothetical protein